MKPLLKDFRQPGVVFPAPISVGLVLLPSVVVAFVDDLQQADCPLSTPTIGGAAKG